MRNAFLALIFGLAPATPALACEPGVYSDSESSLRAAIYEGQNAVRFTLTDGRRGELGAPAALLRCERGRLVSSNGALWRRETLSATQAEFDSHGHRLTGVLMQMAQTPLGAPLVVLVHGSEKSSPMSGAYPYIFAAMGLRVFAYDKRGTGRSEGEYTQNFEVLADDAAAALTQARRMSGGQPRRIGFYGASQGGWVAPLAATRSDADFVAVGFGLLLSPVEEDREQVLGELRARGYGPAELAEAREVTDATARLVASHFTEGYEALAHMRRTYDRRPWFSTVQGEYSGDILAMDETELRRVGRALFDNQELIWNYDSAPALRALRIPLLWILAEEDREAPPEVTRARLSALRDAGVDLDLYSFPGVDHGMVEFSESATGERAYGRITEGYFALLADWMHGEAAQIYGRSRRF